MTNKTDPLMFGLLHNSISITGSALNEARSSAEIAKNQVAATKSEVETEARARRLAEEALVFARRDASEARAANSQLKAALSQKEELLREWMHSNEAFKRLARKYGKKVGVSQEQWQNDVDDVVLEVAEERPEFADTKATKAVKDVRGIK